MYKEIYYFFYLKTFQLHDNWLIGCAIYCVMSNWIEKYELLIRTPQCNNDEPPFIYFDKIAGFNFNNTLIVPENELEYRSLSDLKLFHTNVIKKLSTLHEQKYSIVIFSNLDITKNQSTREEIKHRFDKFCELLFIKRIPIIGIFSMNNEICRKPHTGMWDILCKLYKKNRFPKPIVETSIFVGNEAGRVAVTKKDSENERKPKDNSCIDRAFAWNLRLKFFTPEKFFLNKNIRKFDYPKNILSRTEKLKIEEESKNIRVKNPFKKGVKRYLSENFKNIEQFLIIITGPPSSTKTTLAEYIVRRTKKYIHNYKLKPWTIIDSKTYKNINKRKKKINEEITFGNSVIIDDTNDTIEKRKIFIDIVKKFDNIGILIIELCVPLRIAFHLNHIKIEMLKKFDLKRTSNYSFTQYKKNFQRPNINEFKGIDENRYEILSYPFMLINVKEWWFIFPIK